MFREGLSNLSFVKMAVTSAQIRRESYSSVVKATCNNRFQCPSNTSRKGHKIWSRVMLSWIMESGAGTWAARPCHMLALRLQEGGPPSYFRPRPVSSADTYAKWSAAPPVPDRDEMMTSCETPYFSGVGPQPGISRGLFDGMKYREQVDGNF